MGDELSEGGVCPASTWPHPPLLSFPSAMMRSRTRSAGRNETRSRASDSVRLAKLCPVARRKSDPTSPRRSRSWVRSPSLSRRLAEYCIPSPSKARTGTSVGFKSPAGTHSSRTGIGGISSNEGKGSFQPAEAERLQCSPGGGRCMPTATLTGSARRMWLPSPTSGFTSPLPRPGSGSRVIGGRVWSNALSVVALEVREYQAPRPLSVNPQIEANAAASPGRIRCSRSPRMEPVLHMLEFMIRKRIPVRQAKVARTS